MRQAGRYGEKEKRHGNHIDRRRHSALAGGTAHVASQPTVGLLPQWRAWPDSFDFDHPARVGPVIGGRYVSGLTKGSQGLSL